MNTRELERLGQHAKQFARTYVTVKEALQREGVPPEEAAETARAVMFFAMFDDEEWPSV